MHSMQYRPLAGPEGWAQRSGRPWLTVGIAVRIIRGPTWATNDWSQRSPLHEGLRPELVGCVLVVVVRPRLGDPAISHM
jgi:hypothetical protein